MLQTVKMINEIINNLVWGLPAMVCIIGVGILLTIRTRFLQIRKFPYAIKNTIGKMFSKGEASDGALTPFQAVCTALAATVGTGNIAGVAGAIAIGGPGAVFWMWICALLGMATKFAEAALSVRYRIKGNDAIYMGGPMYIVTQGMGRKWQPLAAIYCFFGVVLRNIVTSEPEPDVSESLYKAVFFKLGYLGVERKIYALLF
jgi:AGCS family alanine or glycine:cation symporter